MFSISIRRILTLLLPIYILFAPVRAVENGTLYQTSIPTNLQVPNWSTGWARTGITGWDYVGQTDGGPSAVYLGNGWVLTAGHVGFSNVTFGGVRYLSVPNSGIGITVNNSPVDLYLFRLATQPDLPALVLRTSDPSATFSNGTGSPVVMIGFGGGKSWGFDTVTENNTSISLSSNQNYVSNDFVTMLGTYASGSSTITNTAFLVSGDSGGGDFIYNSATSQWELAGINEAIGPNPGPTEYSLMVQLDTYKSQIDAIVNPPQSTPAMPVMDMVIMACSLFLAASIRVAAKTNRPSSGAD